MPVYTVEIPTPGTTINRQLIHSVVENLMRNMGIVDQDVMFLGGPYDNASQPNSTVGKKQEVSYATSERTFIEVDEQRMDEGGFTRAVGYDLEAPLFNNADYGIKLSPNYVTYETTITIKRRTPARSMLGGWTNELQRKIDMGMDTFVTEADFHYRIPTPALNLLGACYKALSHNLAEPMSLVKFLKDGFHTGVTVATNEVGNAPIYVARTAVTRVLGSLKCDGTAKQKDGEKGAWTSQFTYTFQFSRPESIVMSYPVMFNNRLISEDWWFESKAPGVSNEAYASKGVAVAMQDAMSRLPETIALPVFIPECDMLRPTHFGRRHGEVDIFVGYLEFELADVLQRDIHHAFNIKDLGNIGFMYNQLTYLRHIGTHDPFMVGSLIKVNIFKDGYPFDKSSVAIDRNLDVWINDTIDITAKYQFTITLDTSLELKDPESLNLIAEVPGLLGDMILEFSPTLVAKYENYVCATPRPPSPESPDLDEYPFNIDCPIPAAWIDPIQDWRTEFEDTFVTYPQYPDKPRLEYTPPAPDKPQHVEEVPFTETIPPEIVDDILVDTVTTMTDARNPNRTEVLSIYQLNVLNGNIIAKRKD